MSYILMQDINKGQTVIVNGIQYIVTGISTCLNCRRSIKIHIVAFNNEINKKIEFIYPETYKFIADNDGKINIDQSYYTNNQV